MTRYRWAGALALLAGAAFTVAGQSEKSSPGPWSGVVINATCNADDAFAEAAKCTAETPGSALALYDDSIRQVYTLDPQDQAKGHLGDSAPLTRVKYGTSLCTCIPSFSL